jgi:hypothetical protein
MAKRVQVILEDDLDGSPAAETVTFGLDGVNYEIDLSEDNAAALRDALAPWVGHANRVGGRKSATPAGPKSGRSRASRDLGAIRDWARKQGHQVSDRGRISEEVLTAYEQARGLIR